MWALLSWAQPSVMDTIAIVKLTAHMALHKSLKLSKSVLLHLYNELLRMFNS